MRKVMLVIDDYSELIGLESLLKRIGFDVFSMGKEVLVSDTLLRFIPDLVIMTFKGRSVDGLRLAARLKKLMPAPKIIILQASSPGAEQLTPDVYGSMADAILSSPAQPYSTIRAVCELTGLDPLIFLEKYERIKSTRVPEAPEAEIIKGTRVPESVIKVGGGAGSTAGARSKSAEELDPWPNEDNFDPVQTRGQAATLRTARSDRYDRFLQNNTESVDGTFSRDEMKAAGASFKPESEAEAMYLQRIDREKKEFVKALFAEKKESE